jgi:PAS domain-containing protein
MRQWELFGITDSEPDWTPRRIDGDNEATPGHARDRAVKRSSEHPGNGSTYLWSTDASLRMRAVSPAGAAYLGRDPEWCEGRELLDVFGMEGPNLAILEAHVAALSDEEGHCTLRGNLETVRCRVAPMHGDDGRVNGTFCIALPDPASEAAERRHATVAA